MKKSNTTRALAGCLALMLIITTACDDFVKIDPPRTELIRQTVFGDDASAESAMLDIYYAMKSTGFASGSGNSISLLTSFSSDEQNFYATNSATEYLQFNNNELLPNNQFINSLWSEMYNTIFKANAIIEGLAESTGVSEEVRVRLSAEAQFIRAFCHFYLVNLWGDVPLILTTDYKQNNSADRTPKEDVYDQIVLDLQDAIAVLPEDYTRSSDERVRANKWVATALLARVHLYNEQWTEAEATASLLIENTTLFSLEQDLVAVYRGTSPEAIFQLWSPMFPLDRTSFAVYFFGPIYGAMRDDYVNSYEANDQRWAVYGRMVNVRGTVYPCYFKYWDYSSPPLDYSTVFRLAEQYLIRAEARLRQQKLDDAKLDLDAIRTRAGLPNTTATTEDELFEAVIRERKAEFPTEWGHRWFDLKRWNRASEVLGPIKAGWTPNDVLFPIPESQLLHNPSMAQNP